VKDDYAIDGVGDPELHQIYRAMAWLGEELPKDQQDEPRLSLPAPKGRH